MKWEDSLHQKRVQQLTLPKTAEIHEKARKRGESRTKQPSVGNSTTVVRVDDKMCLSPYCFPNLFHLFQGLFLNNPTICTPAVLQLMMFDKDGIWPSLGRKVALRCAHSSARLS